ncbi:MAG: hypothetical protein ACREQ5_18075 [Candidatus Dormibacteria bacterium]
MRWYTVPLVLVLLGGVWITIGPVFEPKDDRYALVREVIVGLVITVSALALLLPDLRRMRARCRTKSEEQSVTDGR